MFTRIDPCVIDGREFSDGSISATFHDDGELTYSQQTSESDHTEHKDAVSLPFIETCKMKR